ncbi:MAG: hypothetical protein HC828_10390 [Blastochloris sp.]|nr:hypothetical protein [Blastochloris sp.]
MLLAAILACGAATAGNVRIRDLPQFICATSTPLATYTQAPTQAQPPDLPDPFRLCDVYPGAGLHLERLRLRHQYAAPWRELQHTRLLRPRRDQHAPSHPRTPPGRHPRLTS